jgi:hypothetical protein
LSFNLHLSNLAIENYIDLKNSPMRALTYEIANPLFSTTAGGGVFKGAATLETGAAEAGSWVSGRRAASVTSAF